MGKQFRRREFLKIAGTIVSGLPMLGSGKSPEAGTEPRLGSDDDFERLLELSDDSEWDHLHLAGTVDAVRRPSIDPVLIDELRVRWGDPHFTISQGYSC